MSAKLGKTMLCLASAHVHLVNGTVVADPTGGRGGGAALEGLDWAFFASGKVAPMPPRVPSNLLSDAGSCSFLILIVLSLF